MRLDELKDMQHLVPMKREGGLLKAHAPLSNTTYYYKKNWNLQSQSHKTKKIRKKKEENLKGSLATTLYQTLSSLWACMP